MRRASESVAVRNEAILERIRRLKSDHPFWGYRHCWAHLRYVDRLDVNKKRVYRLMKAHQLLATQTTHDVPRVSKRSKPRPDRPNQWWGIDMTKAITDSGWAYVVVVKDWYTKKVVGHYLRKNLDRGRMADRSGPGREPAVPPWRQGSTAPSDVGQREPADLGEIHESLFALRDSSGLH